MADLEKTMRGLEICVERRVSCAECPYWEGDIICLNRHSLLADALALLREQEPEIKGLRKLVEWAVECDFRYDNLGDWWVDRFKSENEGMSYTEGLIHLAKRYVEIFEGGDGDGD